MKPQKSNITFDDYLKADIRICKILSAERVPETDKLFKMEIDTGIDKRIVVSSIANKITADELINSYMPFVLNLEPRIIKGIESTAMIILGESSVEKGLLILSPHPCDSCPRTQTNDELIIGSTVI